MFNKRKRSSRRWSVRAIETMIVLVALVATFTVLFPKTETSVTPTVQEPSIHVPSAMVEPANLPDTEVLVEESYRAALDYMYAEEYHRSAGLLDAITDVAQDHYWSRVSYSFVLYELGNYQSAIDVATEGIEINPNDGVAWNNRCLLLALTGDFAGALSDCNASIAVAPEYDYSWNNRCYVYMNLGELDLAKADCMQALQNGHRLPEWVFTNLGQIEMMNGDYIASVANFTTALHYNRNHADAYAGMGDLMLVQGKLGQAIRFYEEYEARAGVHYDSAYGEKLDYAREQLANLGSN